MSCEFFRLLVFDEKGKKTMLNQRIIAVMIFCLWGYWWTVQAHAETPFELTQEQAQMRARMIDDLRYQLTFWLEESDNSFKGDALLSFRLRHVDSFVLLDHAQGSIQHLQINEQRMSASQIANMNDKQGHYVLPKSLFKIGDNQIHVTFTQAYSHSAQGLHRFVDPVDKRVYLYSDFEPYDANKMFPCFDQPDLKARFSLRVFAPDSWLVVSSRREARVISHAAQKEWIFDESWPMSTYVFSLHAGPYHVFTSQNQVSEVPLRLLVRQSVADSVDPHDFFEPTLRAFKFFESYFGVPYPYLKYDQLIVPDFNNSAMENIAAVTFSEQRFVNLKSTLSMPQKRRLMRTISHELAHMWFGNLVTMKWWDDLWLNEAMASYFSNLYMRSEDSAYAQAFMQQDKFDAFEEDEQIHTTHPIVNKEVLSTDAAFAHFDAITYDKGAAVMNQLSAQLGDAVFQKGIHQYIERFAHRNATLADFLSAMQWSMHQTGGVFDTQGFSQSWLERASFERVQLNYTCQNGKIKQAFIDSLPHEGRWPARVHAISLGLFDWHLEINSKARTLLPRQDPLRVFYSGKRSRVPALESRVCPALIALDPQGLDYAQFEYAPHILNMVALHVLDFKSQAMRVLWVHLLFKHALVNPEFSKKLIPVWLHLLEKEKDLSVFSYVLKTIQEDDTDEHMDNLLTLLKYKYPDFYESFLISLSSFVLQKLWTEPIEDKEKTEMLLNFYIKMNKQNPDDLWRLLDTSLARVQTLLVTQKKRWQILLRLVQLSGGVSDKHATSKPFSEEKIKTLRHIIEQETAQDNSSMGHYSKLAIDAAWPALENKKTILNNLKQEHQTLEESKIMMSALFASMQKKEQLELSPLIYQDLETLLPKANSVFLSHYVRFVLPVVCQPNSIEQARLFLNNHTSMPVYLQKIFKDKIDTAERCLSQSKKL